MLQDGDSSQADGESSRRVFLAPLRFVELCEKFGRPFLRPSVGHTHSQNFMDEIQREITREPALHVRDEHLFESGIGWPRRTDHLLQGVLAWKQIHHVIVLAPAIRRVCIIGMLAKNRPVQLALAVITLAVQVIYILIEMNALGSW